MNKKIIYFAALAVLVLAFVFYLALEREKEEAIFCAMDVKLCPDGSYVGRIPPDCDFAPCPTEEEVTQRKVLLYYYDPEQDKDEAGNIKCSRDGLRPIEREIPLAITPIQETINLLLKGEEILTEEEITQGITTEYPLEGFSLLEANLTEQGDLFLKFEDPLLKTSGGSCRIGILWFQIEATAKQFPEVLQVYFEPESLFQP